MCAKLAYNKVKFARNVQLSHHSPRRRDFSSIIFLLGIDLSERFLAYREMSEVEVPDGGNQSDASTTSGSRDSDNASVIYNPSDEASNTALKPMPDKKAP